MFAAISMSFEVGMSRRVLGVIHRYLDCAPFNSFIDDNSLVDLPLGGRRFTWCRGDE